jgi:2-succinyl-5-enolpyruvyl-6-hydroxy-3-cyclohexene-1-carboxylate synthase
VLARRAAGRRRGWLDDWLDAERRAQQVLAGELHDEAVLTEPGVARGVVAAGFDRLMVASSMPVRDVEWYGAPSATRVLANRGANGIDGAGDRDRGRRSKEGHCGALRTSPSATIPRR